MPGEARHGRKRGDVRAVFAARLYELRTAAGLSQEELAHAAQVSRTYLSSLERGRKEAGIAVLLKLANALSVDPSALLEGAVHAPVDVPKPRRNRPRLTAAERLAREVARRAEGADEATLKRFATVVKAFFPRAKK